MVKPSAIADALVAALRDIPELVAEVGGDSQRIFAYHDRYPDRVSLELAKAELVGPCLMVAWQGTNLSNRDGHSAWSHRFSVIMRAKREAGQPPDGYYLLHNLIISGVPASGDGQEMQYATIHPDCLPIDDGPEISRQSDAVGVDYFEVSLSFTENS